MTDVTNQQLLKAIKDSSSDLENNIDTKLDIKLGDFENKLESKIDKLESRLTIKIDNLETRLTGQIASNQEVNIKHHLETRQQIGDANLRTTAISDALAKAASVN